MSEQASMHNTFKFRRAFALCALAIMATTSACRAPVPAVSSQAGACGPMDAGYAAQAGYGMYGAPMAPPAPLPYDVTQGNWAPEGIARPWPANEYLRDGGDYGPGVEVAPDWTVYGLGAEDTVAHFDSVKGCTYVEPSNKVSIYAPRFGAVRTVRAAVIDEGLEPAVGVDAQVRLARHEDRKLASSRLQLEKALREELASLPGSYDARQFAGIVSTTLTPKGFDNAYKAYEDMQAIRVGVLQNSEMARLAIAHQAAITWTGDQSAQVLFDRKAAQSVTKDQQVEEVFTVKDLRCNPKLRLIKVASTQTAQPGELVAFTLRFDNIGDQPLGNIVILDSLTTRLEYVEESAQSSVEAEFSHKPNAVESSVLRWEIAAPLNPGEGGVLRFVCRVR